MTLTKKGLRTLLTGITPSYSQMEHQSIIRLGRYRGGFNDAWVWEIGSTVTESELLLAIVYLDDSLIKLTSLEATSKVN